MIAIKNRWINLIIGTIVMLVLGLIYAWSVFAKPLEADFGWNRGQTIWTFTISIIFFVVGLIVAGLLSKKIKQQVIMLIAGVLMAIGFYGCSTINSLWGLYIFYGVFVGFAVGIANNALVSSIVSWFPDMRGLASGILMMGFGLGGFLLTSTTQSMITNIGWRKVFLVFAIVFGIIVAIGFFITPLPSKEHLDKFAVATAVKKADIVSDVPLSQVVRKKSFWFYIMWFAFVMAGGLLVFSNAVPFAEDLGATAKFAALAAGILSVSNGVGRVITGFIFDKFGIRVSMIITTLYLVVASICLIMAVLTMSTPLMLIGFIFTGLCYSGGPTTSSVFSSSFYGSKYFPLNYAALSAGMIPSSILGPVISAQLQLKTGGLLAGVVMMLVFAVIGYVALLAIKLPKRAKHT